MLKIYLHTLVSLFSVFALLMLSQGVFDVYFDMAIVLGNESDIGKV